MRKILLASSLFSGIILSATFSNAQQADRFAYAITDATGQNSNWSFLRKLDLNTGEYSQVLLDGNNAQTLAWDAATKKQMTTPMQDARYGQWVNAAFGTSVAAIAASSSFSFSSCSSCVIGILLENFLNLAT